MNREPAAREPPGGSDGMRRTGAPSADDWSRIQAIVEDWRQLPRPEHVHRGAAHARARLQARVARHWPFAAHRRRAGGGRHAARERRARQCRRALPAGAGRRTRQHARRRRWSASARCCSTAAHWQKPNRHCGRRSRSTPIACPPATGRPRRRSGCSAPVSSDSAGTTRRTDSSRERPDAARVARQ
jgi:hypothetical protein